MDAKLQINFYYGSAALERWITLENELNRLDKDELDHLDNLPPDPPSEGWRAR
jgi:hypothetical protein